MKALLFILSFVTLSLFGCNPPRPYSTELAKLSATLNDTAETINLGDTLKFTLTIPDTIATDTGRIIIKSVQQAYYNY